MGKVAKQWSNATDVWIPKEENASDTTLFCSISLLSVEGKVFFKILANCLTLYLLRNTYIDTAVQKGEVPGMLGCIEHTGVATYLIRETRENRGDLAVVWLDLANAYGSIPHKLVATALTRYHVPERIKDLILDYYNSFSLRLTSGSTTSAWHHLENLTVTATSVPGCRRLLQGLERLITRARMSFKPANSRSLVPRKGRVSDKHRFSLGRVRQLVWS